MTLALRLSTNKQLEKENLKKKLGLNGTRAHSSAILAQLWATKPTGSWSFVSSVN